MSSNNRKLGGKKIIFFLIGIIILTSLVGGIILLKKSISKESKSSSSPSYPNPIPPLPDPNHKYGAIVATKHEPEYQTTPYLLISSVGTENTKKTANNLPAGSALMTDTLDGSGNGASELNDKEITHIIHASPKPRSSFSNDEDFIDCVVKSVQNSIILADRSNFEKLVIPLVGGGIFLGNCDPDKLTEGIIRGSINQLEKCQNLRDVVLMDWEGSSQRHFLKKIFELEKELLGFTTYFEEDGDFVGELKNDKLKGMSVRLGDIRNKSCGVNVIVNAANTHVSFGGGISGAIAKQVGDKIKIDQAAQELIKEFNDLIDNNKVISRLARCGGRGPSINQDGSHYLIFFFSKTESIQISEKHHVFQSPARFWLVPEEDGQQYRQIKISWKEAEKDKKLFEKNDFVKLEEKIN